MPRPPRLEEHGAIHHVFNRGIAKLPIYRDATDRAMYLEILEFVVDLCDWKVLAYCQMENHVHLVIETPEPNLGRGMHRLHGRYAMEFNRRHGFSGHVFQGPYGSKRVWTDAQLWTVAAYVANNPVQAKLCRDPEDWPWGSHRAVVDRAGPSWLAIDRLMDYFSVFGGEPRERYASFVAGRTA